MANVRSRTSGKSVKTVAATRAAAKPARQPKAAAFLSGRKPPFYGIENQGWFLSFHCFTRYVKVTFFRGMSLRPLPPGESKDRNVRYLDIYEGAPPDEAQLASWIRQAAALPGWIP